MKKTKRNLAIISVAFSILALTSAFAGPMGWKPKKLTITTSSPLPSGRVGTPYQFQLQQKNAQGIPTWAIRNGALNPGLGMSAAGLIAGIPTVPAPASFTVQVTDGAGQTDQANFSLTIAALPAPTISGVSPAVGGTRSLGSVTISGNNFGQGATVVFGSTAQTVTIITSTSISVTLKAPPTFSTGSGAASCPNGLQVNVKVTNADGQSATLTNGFTWANPPVISASVKLANGSIVVMSFDTATGTYRLPDGTVGSPYSAQLLSTGGCGIPVWNVTGGALPPGLSMSSGGLISGTPTQAVAGSFPLDGGRRAALLIRPRK